MMQIISAVSERGAIKPGEMALVGSLYTKLNDFVSANQVSNETEIGRGIPDSDVEPDLNAPKVQYDESYDSDESDGSEKG